MVDRTESELSAAALLMRLTVGGLMLFHGLNKVQTGVDWLPGLLEANGLPAALAPGVYIGEVVAPVLLLLGVATRLSAAAIVFTMLMAVYLSHPGDVLSLGKHGEYALELHVFYAVGALVVALIGPGRYAVTVPSWARAL